MNEKVYIIIHIEQKYSDIYAHAAYKEVYPDFGFKIIQKALRNLNI